MSHFQHIRPWLAQAIQPLAETGHSDTLGPSEAVRAALSHDWNSASRSTALAARRTERRSLAISLSLADSGRQEVGYMLAHHLVAHYARSRFP